MKKKSNNILSAALDFLCGVSLIYFFLYANVACSFHGLLTEKPAIHYENK